MSVDISRNSFDAGNHFSRVIYQQGRVTLDADRNEETSVLLHYLRTLVSDVLGPAAAPRDHAGFTLSATKTGEDQDLTIGAGRLYLDGLLVENDEPTTYLGQPFVDPGQEGLPAKGFAAVFLRAWEREVTAVQYPSIREVALGAHGPDTAGRAEVVWQVALRPAAANADDALRDFQNMVAVRVAGDRDLRGRLAARIPPSSSQDTNPCVISPESRYRGPENQLYRVQIQSSGVAGTPAGTPPATTATTSSRRGRRSTAAADSGPTGPTATFVWSRENASVVFGVQEVSGALVTLAGWGRDGRLGLEVGDWVELVDDLTAIRDADEDPAVPPQRLHQVVALDVADRVVTLDADPNDAPTGTPPRPVTGDPALHPYLRRWDHRPAQGAEALPVVLDTWIPLEDGVEVRFSAPPAATAAAPATFRRGDHWLVPARVVPGDVVWPQVDGAPAAVVPHGVDYHYVLLGVFANGKVDGGALSTFAPLFK